MGMLLFLVDGEEGGGGDEIVKGLRTSPMMGFFVLMKLGENTSFEEYCFVDN